MCPAISGVPRFPAANFQRCVSILSRRGSKGCCARRAGGVFAIFLALLFLGQPLYAGLTNGFDVPYQAYDLDFGHKNHWGKGIGVYQLVPADDLGASDFAMCGIVALVGVGLVRATGAAERENRAREAQFAREDEMPL